MSSPSQSAGSPIDLDRAERLKQELKEFSTAGPLKDEYERQRTLFFELSDPTDEHEAESVLDWFVFDWFDEQGEGVIDHFLESRTDLAEDDQEILLDWEDSINSVFEIGAIKKNSLVLTELDTGEGFTVNTIKPLEKSPFKKGQFIAARLLPLGDSFMFSGLQFIMPDRQSALEALEMRRNIEELNSPEALEHAQREQCSAFCELFGCDELTIPSSEIPATIGKFQRYLLAERRDNETGMTLAEKFQQEFGRELKVDEMPPLPPQFYSAGEVTILCDDFDGIVLLPDFNRFKAVFQTDKPERNPDWQNLLWNYIKDPDIPIVAFERVAEQFPERVESVLRKLLDDNGFSIEHLYAVLLHYKQPVEGLDDLDDDRRLWDLLNGNGASAKKGSGKAPEPKPKKQSKAAAKGRATGSKKQAKVRPAGATKKASKASPARKTAAVSKSKPGAAGRSKAAAAAKAPRKAQARKSTSAKKR